MTKMNKTVCSVATLLSSLWFANNVHALSVGCQDLNGRVQTYASIAVAPSPHYNFFGQSFSLEKGEYVTVIVKGTAPSNTLSRVQIAANQSPGGISWFFNQQVTTTPEDAPRNFTLFGSFTTSEDTDIVFDSHQNGLLGRSSATNVTLNFACQNVGDVSQERSEIQKDNLSDMAILGQKQITNMATKRLLNRFRSDQGLKQKQGKSGLAFQLNEQQGKSAGDLSVSSAVWGNVAVTHFADDHRPTNYTGLHGTLMVGADTFISESLVVGGALNVEKSYLDLGRADGEVSSTAIGLTPYLAWRIDDIFSLSAQGNVSFMQSRMSDQLLQFGPVTETDMDALRWNLAVTGDGFWQWGNWGLLSGLNLSYGQLLTRSTIDNQGNRVSGTTSQSGSVSLMIQPSYYWEYDRHLALEPYFLAEYQHDFTMQKVSTPAGAAPHPNDPDQIRLGLGLNIFGGQYYSGNVEATTVVGRKDYTETSLGATLRVNF